MTVLPAFTNRGPVDQYKDLDQNSICRFTWKIRRAVGTPNGILAAFA